MRGRRRRCAKRGDSGETSPVLSSFDASKARDRRVTARLTRSPVLGSMREACRNYEKSLSML